MAAAYDGGTMKFSAELCAVSGGVLSAVLTAFSRECTRAR